VQTKQLLSRQNAAGRTLLQEAIHQQRGELLISIDEHLNRLKNPEEKQVQLKSMLTTDVLLNEKVSPFSMRSMLAKPSKKTETKAEHPLNGAIQWRDRERESPIGGLLDRWLDIADLKPATSAP
jgi:hypothetical protein